MIKKEIDYSKLIIHDYSLEPSGAKLFLFSIHKSINETFFLLIIVSCQVFRDTPSSSWWYTASRLPCRRICKNREVWRLIWKLFKNIILVVFKNFKIY